MKKCTWCKQNLELSCFGKDASRGDGLNNRCRDCQRSKDQKRQLKPGFRTKDAANHRSEAYKKKARLREKKRYQDDPAYAISCRVSSVIYECLRNTERKQGRKGKSLVGYSIEELMDHLENLFLPGMSWDNRDKWHIDHIIPRSAFKITSPDDDEFKECWSLNNLQPLWAKHNISKGNKL